MSASAGFTSLLWFIAIIAMIPIALWLLKRTSIGGAAGHGVMRSVAVLPISNSQRIVMVEVGLGDDRRWLVLGVTPNSITTLHDMAPQGDVDAPAGFGVNTASPLAQAMAPAFGHLLARFKRGEAGTDPKTGYQPGHDQQP